MEQRKAAFGPIRPNTIRIIMKDITGKQIVYEGEWTYENCQTAYCILEKLRIKMEAKKESEGK